MPISGGGRLSGKVNGVNVGVLNMQTDDVRAGAGEQLFGDAREPGAAEPLGHGRDVRQQDGAPGSLSGSGDWNRTWGADARLGVGEHFTMSGFAARTETPGLTGRDYAYNVDSEYDDGPHRVGFEYGLTGEDFNPEVGFLENEDGYRRVLFRFHETMRQEKIRDWGFREWQPHVDLHPVRLPGWWPEQCRAPRRQPLGLGERESHRHGAERRLGRIPCAVRDLSRRRRAGRRTRWPALQDETRIPMPESGPPLVCSGMSAGF